MNRTLTLAVTSAIGIGAMLTGPVAHADERSCRGSIGAVTVDNLRVPAGATCHLTGTTDKGTIVVGTGATLVANSVRVVGNVQAEGHKSVTISRSAVGGSIQLKQGGTASVRSTPARRLPRSTRSTEVHIEVPSEPVVPTPLLAGVR